MEALPKSWFQSKYNRKVERRTKLGGVSLIRQIYQQVYFLECTENYETRKESELVAGKVRKSLNR